VIIDIPVLELFELGDAVVYIIKKLLLILRQCRCKRNII
jgi:hypothetical protein